jgi:hypothetical protein
MILYDDKYNFLGMSSHTLGFLGYEDVGEFLSMHNDFSNLFVNKEGFIYDFDNFNWIDFVLYSGSANKSAIITLKNGRETQVDLSIKEVHLGHDLNGIKKLYSVKVISDKFHEISGVPKNSETTGGIGGFSLSGLVEKESLKEEKVETVPQNSDFQNLISESKPQEKEKKSESFILNISKDEIVPKEEIIEEKTVPDIQDDFKLDFFNESTTSKEHDETSDFTLLQIDSEPDKEKEEPINFLLKSDDLESKTPIAETLSEEQTPTLEAFNLLNDEIKTDKQIEIPSLEIEPNFLKTVELDENTTLEDTEEIKEEEPSSTIKESGFKLDFLKMDLDSVSEPEETESESADNESNYNAIDHTEIIQQIKNDIKEIDSAEEKTVDSTETEENETFVLNIPEMPQVEQPLNIVEQTEEPVAQEHQITDVESLSSFQIQESKSLDANKSFTSTLQSLFGKKDTLNAQSIAEQAQEEAFSFTLKSNRNESTEVEKEKFEKREDTTLTDAIKANEEEAVQNNTQAITFSSLSALGLSPDDEFDLLSDFINDVKESVEIIEQFTGTKDFDKINYSLVKIKSSAEILNLNDIIDNVNSIRKHCITENSEKVIQETNRLKENIGILEKQLEATAI